MIRVCTINDKELLARYLQEEPYGKAVLSAIEQFGFDEKFQTVYLDAEKHPSDSAEEKAEEETVKGVYLWFHKNLILYSKDNTVDIDFLEQMIFMAAPDCVAGRKDNVNIVSWLLTDYVFEQSDGIPELTDQDGVLAECFAPCEAYEGEWGYLKK
jgi:hypothetical protein